MKTAYEKLEMEVIRFEAEDIIRTSGIPSTWTAVGTNDAGYTIYVDENGDYWHYIDGSYTNIGHLP